MTAILPSHEGPSIHELELRANEMRHDIITMLEAAGSGHPGGSLSATDILAALFFANVMACDPADPHWEGRDRLILSKGHAAPALYAAFKQVGWVREEELPTLRHLGSRLRGHPDSNVLEGVEVCSGSLGQGLAISCGIALGLALDAKRRGDTERRDLPHVWCIVGDGEMQEGSNWESLMFGAHRNLSNVTVIVDLNNLQIDGHVTDVNSLGDIDAKLEAFGWRTWRVNGHDLRQLTDTLLAAREETERPTAVVCETVKGKGVSFMEDAMEWHGVAPNAEQAKAALKELDEARANLMKEA